MFFFLLTVSRKYSDYFNSSLFLQLSFPCSAIFCKVIKQGLRAPSIFFPYAPALNGFCLKKGTFLTNLKVTNVKNEKTLLSQEIRLKDLHKLIFIVFSYNLTLKNVFKNAKLNLYSTFDSGLHFLYVIFREHCQK